MPLEAKDLRNLGIPLTLPRFCSTQAIWVPENQHSPPKRGELSSSEVSLSCLEQPAVQWFVFPCLSFFFWLTLWVVSPLGDWAS